MPKRWNWATFIEGVRYNLEKHLGRCAFLLKHCNHNNLKPAQAINTARSYLFRSAFVWSCRHDSIFTLTGLRSHFRPIRILWKNVLLIQVQVKYRVFLEYCKIPNNSRGIYLFQSLNRPGGNLGQAFYSFLTKIRDENVTKFSSFSVNSLASFWARAVFCKWSCCGRVNDSAMWYWLTGSKHNMWKRRRRKTCGFSGHVFFLEFKK